MVCALMQEEELKTQAASLDPQQKPKQEQGPRLDWGVHWLQPAARTTNATSCWMT